MTDDELLAAIRTRGSAGRWTDQPPSQAKPPAAATREAVHAAELTLGHPLPPLLRRLYTEIADGGVGPFCGIQGVTPDTWSTLDDYLAYLAVETEPACRHHPRAASSSSVTSAVPPGR